MGVSRDAQIIVDKRLENGQRVDLLVYSLIKSKGNLSAGMALVVPGTLQFQKDHAHKCGWYSCATKGFIDRCWRRSRLGSVGTYAVSGQGFQRVGGSLDQHRAPADHLDSSTCPGGHR